MTPLPRRRVAQVVLCWVLMSTVANGVAGQDRASAALTEILFDMDLENVSYALRSDGFVDITFGAAVANDVYLEAVQRMRDHPDIPGVLAGRGSANFCPLP